MVDKSVPTAAVLIASVLDLPLFLWRVGCPIDSVDVSLSLVLLVTDPVCLSGIYAAGSREPWIVIPTIITGMGLASLVFLVFRLRGALSFSVSLIVNQNGICKRARFHSVWRDCTTIASALLSYYGHWWPIAIYFALWLRLDW